MPHKLRELYFLVLFVVEPWSLWRRKLVVDWDRDVSLQKNEESNADFEDAGAKLLLSSSTSGDNEKTNPTFLKSDDAAAATE